MTVWCAACSSRIADAARYCDQCGAAIFANTSKPQPLTAAEPVAHPPPKLRKLGALALGIAALGGAVAFWSHVAPGATAADLEAGMGIAMTEADASAGRDPVCVANGLAYDGQPVNVQADNGATLSWMNTLVSAGLYAAPEEGVSGGFFSQPILIYRPLPLLAEWGGARRLCIARAVRLNRVANLGRFENLRLAGKAYPGVTAEVQWALDTPAPWLGAPGVAEAFASELPSWRGARWKADTGEWRLAHRRQFVRTEDGWMPSDAVVRQAGSPPRSPM